MFHSSEHLIDALLESAAQAIIATDRSGKIVLANRQAEEMFGYDRRDLLGSTLELLLPEAQRHAHARRFAAYFNRPWVRTMGSGQDLSARRKDGSEFPVEIGLSHIQTPEGTFAIAFVTDISERKRLESQLMHAQRMEAVGRLAAGVAHDFNNMLTVVAGYGAMALEELAPQDPLRSHVLEILAASNRAGALTGQLLALGRRQIVRPQIIDLNAVVSSTEKMLRRLIGEDIRLQLCLQAGAGNIKVDPACIEQAIVNLVINSRDAMPDGGRITIETGDASLDESYARTHEGVQPGEFVMLAVTDMGCGMNAEVRNHIFEPFFTTKERGKGTGLGLATVYGMVTQAGGDISVSSEPGKGTAFRLYFPSVVDRLAGSLVEAPAHDARRGHETILVVEDDPSVRAVTVKMLEKLGYLALAANAGAEALEIGKAHSGPIDLLLTDVVMPDMNGPQLADALLAVRPGIKVLCLSGYSDSGAIRHAGAEARFSFLPKPFSREALAGAIRDVLGTGTSGSTSTSGTQSARKDKTMSKQRIRLTKQAGFASGMGESSATIDSAHQPATDGIAALAYELWQARGCPEGSPEEDWFRAESEWKARRNGRLAAMH